MSLLRERLQDALGPGYTVERELGRGGMSVVFLAHDNALGRKVAVKLLSEELASGLSAERFKREIMLVAQLQHPHVVGVLSAGDVDGLPYFIMPYVDGQSLRNRLERGPLSLREAVTILRDVARALAYAHEHGVVHRDVKPDNVLLTAGSAALADFGVAKAVSDAHRTPAPGGGTPTTLTQVGTSLGTPAYMSPEQVAAAPDIDHRADLYAFGVLAFEMLAGRPPFTATTISELMAAHLAQQPPELTQLRADLPPGLASLVMRCLAKSASGRPQTAAELVMALEDPAMVSGAVSTVLTTGLPTRRRTARRAIAAAVAVLVGGFLWWMARDRAPAPDPLSIAVLPFVNLGPDTADQYLADGMTEQLTGALGKVPGLRVAPRRAAFSFRASSAASGAIARALDVGTLLEGTVRRDGRRFRVSAELVSAADERTLWSDSYERDLEDVFAVQDSIASAIVGAMRQRLGASVNLAATRRGTENLEAYDLYLRGRFLFEQRTVPALRDALDHFQRAVTVDPGYANAYAGIADVYALLPLYTPLAVDSALPPALRAVDRAIALDSMLATAYASRGSLLSSAWRWAEAERDFRRAVALDPNYVTAHQWYGEHLLVRGRVREAVEVLERAAALDPLAPIVVAAHALALGTARDFARAVARGRRAVELDPSLAVTRLLLAAVLVYAGRPGDALPQLDTALALAPGFPAALGLRGYALAAAGQRERALNALGAIDSVRRAPGAAASLARAYLGLGQIDAALTWLDRAATERDPLFSAEPLASPMYDPLRAEARFAAIVRKVNLEPAVLAAPATP